jgi:hypothetical protein
MRFAPLALIAVLALSACGEAIAIGEAEGDDGSTTSSGGGYGYG